MSRLQRQLDAYPNLQTEQQRLVREEIFRRLTQMEISLNALHDQGDEIMTELQTYIAFVTANVADFNADGTTADATGARNAIDDTIVNYANRQARISGATR